MGGTAHTRRAMLRRVNKVFPGVEKRLVLDHIADPVPRAGDGREGLGLHVSDIINP
jgi:hypothetical protein